MIDANTIAPAVVALLGALGTLIVANAHSLRRDRAQREWEREVANEKRREALYVDYLRSALDAATEIQLANLRMTAEECETSRDRLLAATEQLDSLGAGISVFGSPEIRPLVDEIRNLVWHATVLQLDRGTAIRKAYGDGPIDTSADAASDEVHSLAIPLADTYMSIYASLVKFKHQARHEMTGEPNNAGAVLRHWPASHGGIVSSDEE